MLNQVLEPTSPPEFLSCSSFLASLVFVDICSFLCCYYCCYHIVYVRNGYGSLELSLTDSCKQNLVSVPDPYYVGGHEAVLDLIDQAVQNLFHQIVNTKC